MRIKDAQGSQASFRIRLKAGLIKLYYIMRGIILGLGWSITGEKQSLILITSIF